MKIIDTVAKTLGYTKDIESSYIASRYVRDVRYLEVIRSI
jgi:hypothetical protein